MGEVECISLSSRRYPKESPLLFSFQQYSLIYGGGNAMRTSVLALSKRRVCEGEDLMGVEVESGDVETLRTDHYAGIEDHKSYIREPVV